MSASDGWFKFKTAYQLSPIILTNGIATASGGALPIIKLTDPGIGGVKAAASGVSGTPIGGSNELDGFFANYEPMPGGTLINNQIAMYPFANQAVAANAIIAQPLTISMMMVCPANDSRTYGQKQTTMIALQGSLAQHNSQGGTYSIITPSYIYTNCLMTGMRDISGGESLQVQYRWQFDFVQPLITLDAAAQALNGLMQQITNGTPIVGTPTYSTGLPVNNPTSALNNVAPPAVPPQPSAGNFGR